LSSKNAREEQGGKQNGGKEVPFNVQAFSTAKEEDVVRGYDPDEDGDHFYNRKTKEWAAQQTVD
jgi:hypothetical protein